MFVYAIYNVLAVINVLELSSNIFLIRLIIKYQHSTFDILRKICAACFFVGFATGTPKSTFCCTTFDHFVDNCYLFTLAYTVSLHSILPCCLCFFSAVIERFGVNVLTTTLSGVFVILGSYFVSIPHSNWIL